MADESILRQAWALYKQGRFAAAIESLEAKIFLFREDPEFYRILGLSCLQLGEWKGGETYLQRSQQLEPAAHRETLLGLMSVSAVKKDYSQAVKLGLELLDRDPDDRVAKKALGLLRQAVGTAEKNSPLSSDLIRQWLPTYRRSPPAVRIWALRALVVVVLTAAVGLGSWWGISFVSGPTLKPEVRKGPTGEPLPASSTDTVLEGGDFSVKLTPEEVKLGWNRAQSAFQNYQDSRARYEINRLLLSNASAMVKQRARDLIAYLHEPDFSRPDDTSSFHEVRTSPFLYEGCTVRWVGVISNLSSGTTKITLDLLIGYENGQVVEGIVPVELGFAALLKNSQIVEVLGRIALRDGKWFLQGTSLRDLGYRTP